VQEKPGLSLKKNREEEEEELIMDQLLHNMQTDETNYKNLFLQLNHVPLNCEPQSSLVAVLTVVWSFVHLYSTE
jgi:uncharacterized protein YdiU (UPF0061 family)